MEAEQKKPNNNGDAKTTPKPVRMLAGITAILVIGIVAATIIAAFSGAPANVVFLLIFLGLAISVMIYAFFMINRFLKTGKKANQDEASDPDKE